MPNFPSIELYQRTIRLVLRCNSQATPEFVIVANPEGGVQPRFQHPHSQRPT
jgi:hypothetical protein